MNWFIKTGGSEQVSFAEMIVYSFVQSAQYSLCEMFMLWTWESASIKAELVVIHPGVGRTHSG